TFLPADGVTASYSRATGEAVLGGPYHITAALSATTALSHYTITNACSSFTITPRPATWTTTSNSKTYGDLDPTPLTAGSGTFLEIGRASWRESVATGEVVLGGPKHITAARSATGALWN